MKRIYCDISATTPLDPQISEFLIDLNKHIYGNPSSIHREGQAAKAVIEKSRRQLANALSSNPEEIIFTSSGSESNNMILKGVLNPGDHFITSSYEHPAILKVLPFLESKNISATIVNPDKNGLILPSDIEENINANTRLISIMWVNNELGTINPISEIGSIARKRNILFHSDAVQALGKIYINVAETPVDFLSMSAHKLYGPKGIGALYKRRGSKLEPLIHGGGQEQSLRASTENIGGIAGFGMAAELSTSKLEENTDHILRLESYFLNLLNEQNISYTINGTKRIPGVFNITFHGVNGQDLVLQLDFSGIGISFGSACTSGTVKASEMLLEMGITKEDALSTVRISFGKIHQLKDVKKVADSIGEILQNSVKELA
ncbi:MAG: cysteine desulfurase family protein [Candidatus Marinimicrobia bacterium]|jgi:cysteine desulfurase|nr:cysteine desulfurase family protein [Candidatus Neomarinimicrobiota bacterium]